MEQVLSILNIKEIVIYFFFFLFSTRMVIKKNLNQFGFFFLKMFGRFVGEKKQECFLKKWLINFTEY